MLREIVAVSLKFRPLFVGTALAVMVLGSTQLRDASVNAFPEFTPPQVQIQAEALGLSPAEVEQLITVPLEQDLLNGVQWLSQMRSESAPGLSSIDLIFEPGTDVLRARQAVQERLTQAHALPAVGNPPVMLQPLSSTSRVMMVGLSSRELSLVDLSVLARWKIKPRLMGVPGVANVSIWGQRDRQLQVQVDPDKLRKDGITLNQVINTTGNALWVSPLTFVEASTPGTGGFVDTPTQRLAIQHVSPITTAQGLASVTIQDTEGKTLRLGDVANVVEDHQPLIGDAVISGGPGLMLVVQKFPEASTRDVTQGVEAALDALRPGLSGIRIDAHVYQAETYVDAALHNLGGLAIAGVILMFILLALVLFSWRMALVSVATILLSLIAATYMLYLRGTSFNIMVLLGLAAALGIVVDDAVGDMVNFRRRLREHRLAGGASPVADVLAEASSALRGPLVYATLIVVLAPLPLLFLEGVAGSFSTPAVLSYVLAVMVSTVVALTVGPVLAFTLLRDQPLEQRTSRLAGWAYGLFDRAAPWYLANPRWAYRTVAILLAVGFAAIPQLDGRSLVPSLQDRNLLIHWEAAPGTSLPEMTRITTAATRELRSIPGVRDVGAHVGRAVTSDQVVDVNSGEMWVSMADSADYDSTVEMIGQVLHGYPGLRSDLQTYPQDRVREAQSGTSDPLVVRLYGQDLDVLRSKAEEVRDRISTVPGVAQAKVQSWPEEPALEVEVNLPAAQQYGLSPGDVRRAATTFFSGLLVGNLYEEQKIFDVVVWGSPATRYTPARLADLSVDTPTGDRVRLGDIATVRVAPSPVAITHDGTSRYVDVVADLSNRDLDSMVREVNGRLQSVRMPMDYHAEVLSGLAGRQSQDRRVAGVTIAVAIGIFLLLQAAFASWRRATLVFLMLPLSFAGGLVGAAFVGGVMSVGALAGFVTILGIAARNAVLLIRNYQRLETVEGIAPGLALVLRGTRERLGPVVLSAGAVVAAVLPLLAFGSTAGTELLYPLAAVVLGGLFISVLLTLFVLPVLYLRLFSAGRSVTGGGKLR